MKSFVYDVEISHGRLAPLKHAFSYQSTVYGFDLDALPQLARDLPLFGYNRFSVSAIWDRDYLRRGSDSLRKKVLAILREDGYQGHLGKVVFVTAPRFLHYSFNPVSFYECWDDEGRLIGHIAEVNNTFRERHVYVLRKPTEVAADGTRRYVVPKSFHVSPFNDMEGEYDFRFTPFGEHLDVRLDIRRGDEVAFVSRIAGGGLALTKANHLRTVLFHPLRQWLTMPRILWQAARLYYGKGLRHFRKPEPRSSHTIRVRRPGRIERFAGEMVARLLSHLRHGSLRLVLPEQRELRFGALDAEGQTPSIVVRNHRFFKRLLFQGAVGLGESYTAGEWESEDVTAVVSTLLRNREVLLSRMPFLAYLGKLRNKATHLLNRNSRRGSRRNIRAHYDLSNDLFELFLDPSLMYSSALFPSGAETLEEAQRIKIQGIVEKLRLKPEHSVLEIGSGWGTLAIEMARSSGCRVTTITLSEEQEQLARKRIARAGLSHLVTVVRTDYRDVQGSFDRIVSIEMLEAVGHEFFGEYFGSLERLLAPGGIVVLQVISMPDHRYEEYRRGCDWIQKHIFPGSLLPSLSALSAAMARHSRLSVEHLENIGPHYAPTLREWRKRFLAERDSIRRLGFSDEFIRAWEFYFSYCEAGFALRRIGNLQLVLSRDGNEGLDVPAVPAGIFCHGDTGAQRRR